MSNKILPNKDTSIILSGLLFLITFSGLELYSTWFRSTPQTTIFGGFISSLLFVFSLIFIGNFENETNWKEVFLCEFIALVIAGTVHRVCITTCFLFSIGFLFYMNSVSKYFYYSDNNKKK